MGLFRNSKLSSRLPNILFFTDVPYLIPIKSSQSGGHYNGYKDVSGAHDGYVEGQYSCYQSSHSKQGWAEFKLEKVFHVTKVSVAPITG